MHQRENLKDKVFEQKLFKHFRTITQNFKDLLVEHVQESLSVLPNDSEYDEMRKEYSELSDLQATWKRLDDILDGKKKDSDSSEDGPQIVDVSDLMEQIRDQFMS